MKTEKGIALALVVALLGSERLSSRSIARTVYS